MIRWIRQPQEIDPGNGMPDLSVSTRDGRDIAAYLYTLQKRAPL
jgi:cytochrome c1